MFVEKWMTPNPLTVQPEATVSFVAMQMNRRKFQTFSRGRSHRNRKPIGRHSVQIRYRPRLSRANLNPFSIEVFEDTVTRPVSTVMTKKCITTTLDCPDRRGCRVIRRNNRIGALPVITRKSVGRHYYGV